MKWLYHFKKKWLDGDSSPLQGVYLRPTKMDENRNILVGKIIDLNVIAMEYFMKDGFKNIQEEMGLREIYFKELGEKEYFIQEENNEQEDLFMNTATIYIKNDTVTPDSMLGWIKVYLNINGISFSEFQETHYDDFSDINPFLRLLSEGAREMENKWGKEWWKRNDKGN